MDASTEETTERIAQPALSALKLDARRSLAVTDQPILARFTFKRVMDQLAAQTGEPGTTGLTLFNQWWDTQNPAPGFTSGPHCDDQQDLLGGPTLNGYPYACRPSPSEGGYVGSDPFGNPDTNPDAYIAIGLFNRMDLAPVDGAHCGEHRIVFAKRSGVNIDAQRNLVIFEATLPNPSPGSGLAGCRSIAMAWGELTNIGNLETRASKLEALYFSGSRTVPPVIHIDNFGAQARGGQIRTNQFVNATFDGKPVWSLREFKLVRTCVGSDCRQRFVPVTVKTNPFGPLFAGAAAHPNAVAFQARFLDEVPGLLGSDVTQLGISVDDAFNTAQSQASGSDENKYDLQLGLGDGTFAAAIASRIPAGRALTPANVAARALTTSCAGCHRLSANSAVVPPLGEGMSWPKALGFVHVSERASEMEIVGGVKRYKISPALTDVFLPHRKRVLDEYLAGTLKPRGPTMGGPKRTH